MKRYAVIFLLGIIALLTGMWGGLLRIGVPMPGIGSPWSAVHGPLMVSGFLGTLITLERAVAMGVAWTFLSPLSIGIGSLLLILGISGVISKILILLGSFILIAMLLFLYREHKTRHFIVMSIGALLWSVGNFFWLYTSQIPLATPWWVGFLLLTIAAERLELRKFFVPSVIEEPIFWLLTLVFIVGLVIRFNLTSPGILLTGLSTIGFGIWLIVFDTARKTIRQPGLTRFIGISLLLGYVWLGVSGVFMLFYQNVQAGLQYDAILHSFFLGFVFSMVFGHAPIVIPSITGFKLKFTNRFYTHLVLLHISVLLRIIGDLAVWIPLRQWGGILSVIAILLFFINNLSSSFQSA